MTTPRRSANPSLIYHPAAFQELLDRLADQPLLALDTESDSLFSYYTKVCLIQITTYADGVDPARATDDAPVVDYLVDPLRYTELGGLAELLADPRREVLIHAAENDIMLLQREFGFTFPNVFDTQLAARILGWERAGLAAILEEQFGVVSDKRMQRTNWGKRPLTPEQIAYAQMDTHYLPALRVRQIAELRARDRWEEAQEAFAQLSTLDYNARPNHERDMWQMKEIRQVPLPLTGVLEALWLWREQEAQRQDRPPFKVVGNRALIELTERRPSTLQELAEIDGLGRAEIQRYGNALLAVLAEGKTRPLPALPAPTLRPEQMLDRAVIQRYDALRNWRAETARDRGVAPEIVMTNEVLLEIAKEQPRSLEHLAQVAGLGPWKLKTYGPAILRLAAR